MTGTDCGRGGGSRAEQVDGGLSVFMCAQGVSGVGLFVRGVGG